MNQEQEPLKLSDYAEYVATPPTIDIELLDSEILAATQERDAYVANARVASGAIIAFEKLKKKLNDAIATQSKE